MEKLTESCMSVKKFLIHCSVNCQILSSFVLVVSAYAPLHFQNSRTRTSAVGWKFYSDAKMMTQVAWDTHTLLTALFRDYPGEPIPER